MNICYYSFENSEEAVNSKLLRTLIDRSGQIFDILWNKHQEKRKNELIINFVNGLLITLPNFKEGGEFVGQLIENYSKIDKVAEGIKTNLMEFYKTHLFSTLNHYPQTLKH